MKFSVIGSVSVNIVCNEVVIGMLVVVICLSRMLMVLKLMYIISGYSYVVVLFVCVVWLC